jgi:hypothetical protein
MTSPWKYSGQSVPQGKPPAGTAGTGHPAREGTGGGAAGRGRGAGARDSRSVASAETATPQSSSRLCRLERPGTVAAGPGYTPGATARSCVNPSRPVKSVISEYLNHGNPKPTNPVPRGRIAHSALARCELHMLLFRARVLGTGSLEPRILHTNDDHVP